MEHVFSDYGSFAFKQNFHGGNQWFRIFKQCPNIQKNNDQRKYLHKKEKYGANGSQTSAVVNTITYITLQAGMYAAIFASRVILHSVTGQNRSIISAAFCQEENHKLNFIA